MSKAKLNMIGMVIVLIAVPLSGIAKDDIASLTDIVGKVLIEKDNSVVTGRSETALFLNESIIALRGASARVKFANGCSVSVAANKRLSIAEAASCCGVLQGAKHGFNATACHSPRRLQAYAGGAAGDPMPRPIPGVNPMMYQTLSALTGGVLVTGTSADTQHNTTLSGSGTVSGTSVPDTLPDSNGSSSAADRPLTDTSSAGGAGLEVTAVKVPELPSAPPRPQVFRPMLSADKTSDSDGGFSFLDPTPPSIPPSVIDSSNNDGGDFFIPAATSLSDC